eukprot:scaffold2707_cov417-Prasinococcus_capsulatus_cf.AAC.32
MILRRGRWPGRGRWWESVPQHPRKMKGWPRRGGIAPSHGGRAGLGQSAPRHQDPSWLLQVVGARFEPSAGHLAVPELTGVVKMTPSNDGAVLQGKSGPSALNELSSQNLESEQLGIVWLTRLAAPLHDQNLATRLFDIYHPSILCGATCAPMSSRPTSSYLPGACARQFPTSDRSRARRVLVPMPGPAGRESRAPSQEPPSRARSARQLQRGSAMAERGTASSPPP